MEERVIPTIYVCWLKSIKESGHIFNELKSKLEKSGNKVTKMFIPVRELKATSTGMGRFEFETRDKRYKINLAIRFIDRDPSGGALKVFAHKLFERTPRDLRVDHDDMVEKALKLINEFMGRFGEAQVPMH